MSSQEPTTIGLSESAHRKLKDLEENQHFHSLLDGYRFAVGLAVAQGVLPPEVSKRTTIFNVGTFDPDQAIKESISALMEEHLGDTPVYRYVERLAEWGVNELAAMVEETGKIEFVDLLEQSSRAGEG